MFNALCREWDLSKYAIRDLETEDGFVDLVEGLVKANWGMNWEGFWECVYWNLAFREYDEVRMGMEEEKEIVKRIRERWLLRHEAGYLLANPSAQVDALQSAVEG